MIRSSFNANWQVAPAENLMSMMEQNKVEPQMVTLPYDVMPDHPRTKDASSGASTGFFPDLSVTMKKVFHVPEDWAGRAVTLEFEGVYRDAMVYINGDYAGGCPHGYTKFLVSCERFLVPGKDNEVKVTAHCYKDSRWYSGAGIYRNVNLMVGGEVHIQPDSYRISTPEIDMIGAVAEVSLTVTNRGLRNHLLTVKTVVVDADGQTVACDTTPLTAYCNADATLRHRMFVPSPKRWDIDTPNLYTAKTEVYEGDTLVDTEQSTFGFRTLQLDTENGLRINGKTVKLRGACIHHDNGPIGAAAINRAEERRVQLLKQAGFNAVRSAHNPISRQFLDACDKYGVVVMDELTDMWTRNKTAHDYATSFVSNWRSDAEALVAKDYNHPSVIMYSIGNEIPDVGSPQGATTARAMTEWFHELDSSRYVINSVNLMLAVMDKLRAAIEDSTFVIPANINDAMGDRTEGINEMSNSEIASVNTEESFAAVDISGYNYATARYTPDRELYPNRVICGSETFPNQIYNNWDVISKSPHVIGDFTWTGWDYLGEAGIGKIAPTEGGASLGFTGDYPWYIAYCGDIDIIGNRRPVSYYREIVFGLRKEPYITAKNPENYGKQMSVSIWGFVDGISSWTWNGFEGKPIEVEIYADADRVELLLNGNKVGESVVNKCKALVDTVYIPGELVAVAYKGATEVGRTAIKTAGTDLRLCAEVDRDTIRADDTDLAYIMVSLVDGNGVVNTCADRKVSVNVSGAGELIGMGAANPKSEESFRAGSFTTFDGYVLAIVRPVAAGEITVTVSAEGLDSQTLTINAKP